MKEIYNRDSVYRDSSPNTRKSWRFNMPNSTINSWIMSSMLILALLFSSEKALSQISLPYTENFGGISVANGFPTVTGGAWTRTGTTTLQPTYITNQGNYNRSGNGDTKFMSFRYSNAGNLYAVGPFTLTAGVSYTSSVLYKSDGLSGHGPLTINYGTAATIVGQTNVIASKAANILNANYETLSGAFTPSTTGSYYLSVRLTNTSGPWYLTIDDFKLEVTPTCVSPSGITSNSITSNSTTISWTAPSSAPSEGYNYEIRTSGAAGSGATGLASSGSVGAGILTKNISGLSPSTSYSVYTQSNCGSGDLSSWSSGVSFTTTQIAATLPYTQDFSGSNGFSFVNGTQANQWVNGSAAGNTGNSIYISNDAGTTNAYSVGSTSVTQAYRDITIPAGATLASLSFDWQANGESSYDFLRVWLVPTNFIPTAGTQIGAGTGRIQVGTNFGLQTTWQNYTNGTLNLSSFANSTMRLVFEWTNDISGGAQTPAAVDNISLTIPSCVAPTALVSSAVTATTAVLSWTASTPTPTNGYDIYYSTTNTAPLAGTTPTVENHTASPLNETGLTPASTYYWWVRSDCGGETSTWASGGSFITLCNALTSFPWTENFESITTPNLPICWSANDANADGDKWITYATYGVGSSNAAGLYTDSNAGVNNDYLILPRMTLTGVQRLKFSIRARSAGEPNDYRVVLSTTGNQPADFTNVLMPLTTISSITMTEIAPIDLSAYTGDVYIAIHVPAGGLDGWYLYTDDFSVYDVAVCSGTPTAATVASSVASVCLSGSVTLTATLPVSTDSGFTYQWYNTSGIIAGATTNTYVTPVLSAEESYYFRTTCTNGDASVDSNTVTIGVNNPSVVTTVPSSRCGVGSVDLSATGSAGTTVSWYGAATGGAPLSTGNAFTTPSINETTTFYVQASEGATVESGGRLTTLQTSGFISLNYGIQFNVSNNVTLNSTVIYPVGSGTVTIALINSLGTELMATAAIPVTGSGLATPVTVPLNFTIPLGTGYRLQLKAYTGLTDIIRDSSNAFPYNSTNTSVTGGWTGSSSLSYYYFYNLQISSGCSSARTAVIATVDAPPALTVSDATLSICSGANSSAVTLTSSAASYNTYTWSPASGVSGDEVSGWVFNPTATTTYTLTASQTGGSLCAATTSIVVTVNPLPSAITFSPAVPAVCVNAVLPLSVIGGTSDNIQILSEDFNGAATGWTSINNSTGGTVANGAWNLYLSGAAFSSNDNSNFIMSNSDSQGSGGTTDASLTSPSFDLTSFTAATLSFYHIYKDYDANDQATVQVSTNGSTWVNLQVYTSSQGTETAFALKSISLNAYVGNPSVKVRFKFNASYGYYWAIDNVTINGNKTNDITWSPITNLYTDAAATAAYINGASASKVYVKSASAGTTNYTATATSAAGCTTSSAVNVTVSVLPTVVTVAPATVCAGTPVNLTLPAVTTGSDSGLVYTYFTDAAATTVLANANAVTTPGTYYIKGTNANLCSAIASVVVSTNQLPTVVTVAPAAVCSPETVDLTALAVTTGSSAGLTFTYFTDALATIALTTPNAVTASGTYYIKGTNANGCSSVASVLVTVKVTDAPTANAQVFCDGATVNNLVATGTTLQWYAASTGGTALSSVVELSTGTYYVSQTLNACESPRTSVGVTVHVTLAPTADAQALCNGTVANLTTTSGTAIKWYAAATGGTALANGTALVTGNYYVTQTLNACESPRTEVAVTANVTLAPTGSPLLFCNDSSNATVANLTATGTNLKWYTASTGGTALLGTTVLLTGTNNYYASQTINSCEGPRVAIEVKVGVVPTVITVAPAPIAPAATTDLTVAGITTGSTGGLTFTYFTDAGASIAVATPTAVGVGTYYIKGTNAIGCSAVASVKISSNVTTYESTGWDYGVPTASIDAVINSNFNTTVDLSVKSLTINTGKVITVKTGTTLTVVDEIVNNAGVTGFIIENDGVLLQTATTANTSLAAATVKRNSTSLFRQDYTLWSSPVFEPNLRNFSPNTIYSRFYSYGYAETPPVGDGGVYVQEITDAATVISKKFGTAKGYLIRMPNITDPEIPGYSVGASGTYEMPYNGVFTGKLNNGTLSTPLYGVSAGVSNGLTLVGNPYPSPINILQILAVNPQITGTMYFWRKKNSIVNSAGSGYVTYSSGTGSVTGADLGGGQTLTHIKTGQGFFVQSIGASPAALEFNNTMREKEATAGIFFKSGADAPTTEMHRYWLNLSDATNVVGQTLVAYATGATQGVDSNFDALYFNDSPLALTSIINNAEYIIQGRAVPFMNTDVVPLGFKTDVAGSFTIALANFDGVFADNQDIFLLDKSNNTVHNLKTAAYTFTTPVGVFNERFEVKYEGSLGTNNPSLASNNILIAVKDQQIKINAGSVVMEKIELIDVAGRVIFTLEGVNATTATLENVVSSNQMLVVRISTKENGVVTQKIIF